MLYITLRQLEYVVAIAHAGSITEAARTLNVSQPALSVAISRIEQRQGQKLFIRRKGAPVSLTSFGQAFIVDAEALLTDAARLEDPEKQARRQLDRIVLGCYEDIAPIYLAPTLRHLRQNFPDVEFIPRIAGFEALANGVLEGEINLSITYDLGLDANFEKHLLANVAPHAFFSPGDPLSEIPELKLQDLSDSPLILFDQGLSIKHMIGLFRARNLLPRIAYRVTSLEIMRSLAANGEGIGISYTRPPTNISYDGKPVCTKQINDPEAQETVILAYSALNPPMQPLPEILACIIELNRTI